MGMLSKLYTEEIVPGDPPTPPQPGSAPVAFRLFAPPSPPNAAWRQKGNFPSQPAHFNDWSQMWQPSGAQQWYGPINHMTYVVFPDQPIGGNGYPLGPGPDYEGYFDVDTPTGLHREWRTYRKTGAYAGITGILVPVGAWTDPPYCTTGGPCMPTMQANFPGSNEIPGTPGTPDTLIISRNEGWNAGANSFSVLGAGRRDLRLAFSVSILSSGVVGFADAVREAVGSRDNILHGFLFQNSQFAVIESGVVKTPFSKFEQVEDEFEVLRRGDSIEYWHYAVESGRSTLVMTSEAARTDALRVGSALYRGGDYIL